MPMPLRHLLLALTAAAVLCGCHHPPVLTTDPISVEEDKVLDRVHVRDDSALYQETNRGGAAFRQQEVTHVLFNKHHTGQWVLSSESRDGARANALGQGKLQAKDSGAALKASSAPAAGKPTAQKKSSQSNVRDRSIYSKSKDKSIYAQKPKAQP